MQWSLWEGDYCGKELVVMHQMLLTWCSTASIIHDADAADIDEDVDADAEIDNDVDADADIDDADEEAGCDVDSADDAITMRLVNQISTGDD